MTKAITENKKTITSLELLEQINFFRKEEGKKKPLRHNDLLKIIRNEFDEEIREGKISLSSYKKETGNKTVKEYPMYILSISQGKQVLMRESKFVRRSVIQYLENLEKLIENSNKNYLEEQKKEFAELKERVEVLEKAQGQTTPNMTVSGYARVKGIYLDTSICSNIGKMATHICKTENIFIKKLYDSKYGFVNTYPMEILEKVFDMYFEQ